MAPKVYNIAIIGYGLSAKIFHIPFIPTVQGLNLYAIVNQFPQPDDNIETRCPGVKVYSTTEEMLKDPAVDVVVLSTPPTTHLALATAAIKAGKHVVCEKPLTPMSAEGDQLIATAKEYGKLLTVFHNRRWDTDFLTLQKLINEDTLGRIVEFETHFDRYDLEVIKSAGGWRGQKLPGAGVIYDLGVHLMDQVNVLFGMPEKVTGFEQTQREEDQSGIEDACTVLLHYKSGLLVTVKAAVISPEKKQLKFWVRGQKGSYRKYHLDSQEEMLQDGKHPGSKNFGVEKPERYGIVTVNTGNGFIERDEPTVSPETYAAFYKKLLLALEGKGPVPVDPKDGRDVIRLVELAHESSRLGKTLSV
ncbi:MAG: hypothetical protein M1834_007815 [Cirrosporium novae-zelandiae]|nr:MAG: hypothetical protein M1834_007815 [Cirrosporium novae-zelandiae]